MVTGACVSSALRHFRFKTMVGNWKREAYESSDSSINKRSVEQK